MLIFQQVKNENMRPDLQIPELVARLHVVRPRVRWLRGGGGLGGRGNIARTGAGQCSVAGVDNKRELGDPERKPF